jgi:hypothetical protein
MTIFSAAFFFGPIFVAPSFDAALFIATFFHATSLFAAVFRAKLVFVVVLVVVFVVVFVIVFVIGAAVFVTVTSGQVVAGENVAGKLVGGKSLVAGVGRGYWSGFRGRSAEIGRNGLLLELAVAQGFEIFGHRFFFVKPDLAGVGPDETLIEDSAGELVKVFIFEGAQHAGADFGGIGDGLELDAAPLALLAKFFSKGSQGQLLLSFRPHRDAFIIGERREQMPEVVRLRGYRRVVHLLSKELRA